MASYDAEIRVRTSIDNSKFDKGAKGIQHSLREIEKQIDAAKEKLKSLEELGLPKTSQIYKSAAADLKKWNAELESVKKKQIETSSEFSEHLNLMRVDVEEYANTLKQLEKEGQYFGDADYDKVYLAWKNAVDEVKKYQAELNKQTEKGQAEAAEKTAKALERQEAAQRRIEAQAKKNQQIENARIQKEAEKQAKLQAEADEAQRLAQIKANATVSDQKMVALLERRKQLQAEIKELEQAGVTAGYREYDSRSAELEKINRKISAAKKNIKDLSSQIGKIGSTMKGLLEKIQSPIQKAFGMLTSGANRSTKAVNAMRMSFVRMLAMSVAFSAVFRAISVVSEGLGQGFTALMKYSDSLASSVQSLKNALSTLGNSFAAAFSPIVQTAIPYLVQLINWVTRAVNAIGQLFAYLTGKSTWTKATEVQAGYNDELNGTADAAKKAYGALAKFDDLDVLQKQDSSSGGAGGSGGAATGGFEEVPISEDVKKFGDQLKDIFSKIFAPLKEAWEREGQFVMNSWKYALEEIGLLVKDIGRDFLEVWNQEATIAMFEDILHIIGDIGLVVGNLAHNFREAWNENETGLHILENIRDIFAVIIHNIRLAADATVEWSKYLDFSPLLTAFERFTEALVPAFDALSGILTDFYTQVLLPLGKWVLEKGLPDLLGVLTDFVDEVEWERLRQNFSDLWDSLGPFAKTVGEGLILFIERVSDLVADFLNSDEFEDFLDHLGEWMDSVTPEDVADGIENLAKAFVAVKGALVVLDGIIAGSKIISFLGNLKSLTGGLRKGGAALAGGAGIIGTGATLGIFEEIGRIKDNLFGPDEIKDAQDFASALNHLGEEYKKGEIGLSEYKDGIGKLSEEARNAGIVIDEDFQKSLEDITLENTGKNVAKDFSKGIEKGLEEEKEVTSANFSTWSESLGETMQTSFRSIGALAMTVLKTVFEERWEDITSLFSVERWSSTLENVKTAFQTKWSEIVEWWQGTALYIWWEENVSPWFTQEKWTELFNNIWLALQTKWSELVTWWQETALYTWWEENVAPWFTQEKWLELYATIKDAIVEKWNEMVTWWKTNIKSWWDKNVDPWFSLETWQKLGEHMKEGIYAGFKGVANKIVDILNDIISSAESMVNEAIDGINSFLGKIGATKFGEYFDFDFSIGNVSFGRIPHLASGAVIQGGNPFLAVLGDQRAGQTNIEAPLSTIRQAVRDELSGLGFGGGQMKVVLQVNGVELAQATLQDFLSEMNRQGYDVEVLGV